MYQNNTFQSDSHHGGSEPTTGYVTDDQITQNQPQVKESTNIMQQNIERALERDVNLTNLENKTEALQISSEEFKTVSNKTKKKYLWKNRKWTIILIAVILVIIAILAIGIGVSFSKKN